MLARAGSDVMTVFQLQWPRCDFVFLFFYFLFCPLQALVLAPVHWNSSNPIFKSSKNDHIIEVNAFDEIDFICPHHPTSQRNDSQLEYYLIYRVSEEEYKGCSIYSEADTLLLLNCSHPHHKRRYTILFEPHQSIPNAPEYKPGMTYYFITTSTGRREGLNNIYHGACLHQNMKLKIRLGSNNPDYSSISLDDEDRDDEDDEQDNAVDEVFFHLTEAPSTPTRRHHSQNKRPQPTRPPTFEDNLQPYVPRRGQKHKVGFNQQQKTHRRQTHKNTTAPFDTGQHGGDQRGSKQTFQNGGKQQQQQMFHYSQVPSRALDSSSTSGQRSTFVTSFPLTLFMIFGHLVLLTARKMV